MSFTCDVNYVINVVSLMLIYILSILTIIMAKPKASETKKEDTTKKEVRDTTNIHLVKLFDKLTKDIPNPKDKCRYIEDQGEYSHQQAFRYVTAIQKYRQKQSEDKTKLEIPENIQKIIFAELQQDKKIPEIVATLKKMNMEVSITQITNLYNIYKNDKL